MLLLPITDDERYRNANEQGARRTHNDTVETKVIVPSKAVCLIVSRH
jgi:hypothetical protein